MELLQDQDVDSLSTLEERIHRAIELVARLRHEKEALMAERDAALQGSTSAQDQIDELKRELESLKAERQQVRNRVEKLLSQIDSLSAV